MPNGVFNDADRFGRHRCWQVQYLADLFWTRWTREYLPTLRARTKWSGQYCNVWVNDLVLVIKPRLPKYEWLLGRLVEALHCAQGNIIFPSAISFNRKCIHVLPWWVHLTFVYECD